MLKNKYTPPIGLSYGFSYPKQQERHGSVAPGSGTLKNIPYIRYEERAEFLCQIRSNRCLQWQ